MPDFSFSKAGVYTGGHMIAPWSLAVAWLVAIVEVASAVGHPTGVVIFR